MIAEKLAKWHMISEIIKAVVMFFAIPIWFFWTIFEVWSVPDVCKQGWEIVNYLNLLLLEFYAVTPTFLVCVILLIGICCLPCIIKAFKEQARAQQNQQ